MNAHDRTRVQHMLDAAQTMITLVDGYTKETLTSDIKTTLAVIRLLEIIGEAANRVSAEVKEQNNQIPWSQMVAMRNRLIHAYFDVDEDIVWDTVTVSIPVLIAELEALLV